MAELRLLAERAALSFFDAFAATLLGTALLDVDVALVKLALLSGGVAAVTVLRNAAQVRQARIARFGETR